MVTAGATTIGRARVSGVTDGQHSLAARLAVAGSLAGADLEPAGLPPAAILIIDRLAASMRLPLRPGARVDPTWERATRAAVAGLYRRAARPIDGPPPPNCPAVLFRDEAELLACLTLDISLGRTNERWWWRAYLRRWGSLNPSVVAALLAEKPRATPAALRLLAERDVAHQVLQHLTPFEAQQVLRAVCVAFDAPRLAQAATVERQPLRPAAGSAPVQSGALEQVALPWQPFTPPQTQGTGLAPHSACLLGVALVLAQAPAVARSLPFAQAVERWLLAQTAPRPDAVQPESRAVSQTVSSPSSVPDALAGVSTVASPLNSPLAMSSSSAGTVGAKLPTFPKVGNFAPTTALSSIAPDNLQEAHHTAAELGIAASNQHPAVEPAAPAELQDGVATELGGVLFLINVMHRLDLPACFEDDWRLASAVGPWGVLELLGRGMLASKLPTFPKVGNFDADPLWSALAAIDGRRTGELPGGATTMPDRLNIPASWSRWLGAGEDGAGQAEIASPSLAMTTRTMAPLDGSLLTGVSRDLRMWLAWVTPLLHRMLRRALGDGSDVTNDLLLRRGRLYVTSTHVDVVMPLDSVSMPVRVAGLDFDPGWLPAFGRVVQFHYER